MSNLLSNSQKNYGNKYKDHFFEQYKIFIDSTEKTNDRRQQANNYFIAINTALISLIGLVSQNKVLSSRLQLFGLLTSLLGIIICIIFWFLINSYKQLNTGKFSVIHKIEEYLPLSLYKYEWDVLGKGEDKKKYYPFSHIELLIPVVFGVVYILLGSYFLYN